MEQKIAFYFERQKKVKLEFQPDGTPFTTVLGKRMNNTKSCTI